MRTARFAGVAALLLAVAMLIPSGAGAAEKYAGKTKGGSKITFVKQGKRIKGMQTLIYSTCFPSNGTGMDGGFETFRPGKAFRAGSKVRVRATRYSALGTRKVGMNHTIQTRVKRRGKLITGRLTLSYFWSDYDIFTSQIILWNCFAAVNFTASRR